MCQGVHSDEFEPPPEEEHFDSYTLRNVAEIIVGTENKYDLAYGLLARKRKKDRLYNIVPEGSVDVTEKIKSEPEEQPLPNSQLSGGFSTQALLMGSQGDQQRDGRNIEDLKRTAKTFVVNQSIIDYLSQDQW